MEKEEALLCVISFIVDKKDVYKNSFLCKMHDNTVK